MRPIASRRQPFPRMKVFVGFVTVASLFVPWHFMYDLADAYTWEILEAYSGGPKSSMDNQVSSRSRLPTANNVMGTIKLRVKSATPGAIHMIITSMNRNLELRPREICGIESAARLHPDKRVTVTVDSSAVTVNPTLLEVLRNNSNVRLVRFDLDRSIEGTPLSDWYRRSGLDRSPISVVWRSDLFRLATLYKHGGWYVDTDEIALKPFTHLRNSLATEENGFAPNGNFLAFDRGHQLLMDTMLHLTHTVTPASIAALSKKLDKWMAFGPSAFRQVLRDKGWCEKRLTPGAPLCRDGLTLLPGGAFSPLPVISVVKTLWASRAQGAGAFYDMIRNAHGVHLHSFITRRRRVLLRADTVVAEFFKTVCPITCEMVDDEI